MPIHLERPMVVIDLESTGVNYRYDRIIEIGAVKVHPDGTEEVYERRVNPERPIPMESQDIHGITDDDVEDELPFHAVAGELLRFLQGCDICGFGVQRFDIPMLAAEFSRVGVVFPDERTKVVDAQVIFHKREPRTLTAALKLYCGKDHDDAHSAIADVRATMDVLQGQLAYYGDLPWDFDGLAAVCSEDDADNVDREGKLKWSGDEVMIAFGQKAGISLREMAEHEPGYLKWMLRRDFSPEIKSIVQNALAGTFPKRGS